ncbi:serine/threonine-protein phosphatase 6 regulatory ankyrin repeat subunit B-like isoform X2 [Mytilus edulis]|uniref:serine/threonine-protein phosphatase 6 regulatory ankyrin repeat subunit B-like isoform X2 n=1 Tax=Mytilus edulis TaxID=6550 RepID=UPI0039EF89E1
MKSSLVLVGIYIHVAESVFKAYVDQCPLQGKERIFRSTSVCQSVQQYHCLYDDDLRLAEICQTFKQLPPGNYPRYSSFGDDIYYDPCPAGLYQMGPAKSYEITNCLFTKSHCTSEGQIVCSNGSEISDVTCRCDYQNGYAMGQTKCCSPTLFEDCTCYKKRCPDENQELDPDYRCVNKCKNGFVRKQGEFVCTLIVETKNITEPISNTSSLSLGSKKRTDLFVDNAFKQYDLTNMKTILFTILGIYILHIVVMLIYGAYNETWRPFRFKLFPFLAWTLIVTICLALSIVFADFKWTAQISFSVFTAELLCVFLLFLYLLYTHEIVQDLVVFNEEYEIRIFKLLTAASEGDIVEMQRLRHESCIDMEDVDYDSRSALHQAACSNRIQAVDFIVKHHLCFPEATDRWNRSAEDDVKWHQKQNKYHHLDDCYKEVLEKLKKYKEQYQSKRKEKTHFRESKAMELIKAAEKGDLHTIKRLFKLGTDMNLPNSAGRTALHAAAENGMKHIVDYLIDKCEVSPFVRWSDKRPIEILKVDENEITQQISERLQRYMDDLREDKVTGKNNSSNPKEAPPKKDVQIVRLLNCASRGDIKRMRQFKECGYKMDAWDYDKRTALHIAVSDNQEHIVKFLLGECNQQEIAKNGGDRWNITPWEAAKSSAMDVVYNEFLNHCPELMDTENDDYRTCRLIYAAATNDISTLQSLHEKKVDMNLRDYDGRTALHLAAANGHVEAVEFLVKEANVTVEIPDRENRFPIDDGTEKVKKILQECQNNTVKKTKLTPKEETLTILMTAASKGNLHKLDDFKYKYFKMDSGDYLKDTPLHVAAAKGRIKDVKYLLNERQVSPFARNSFLKMPVDLVNEKINFWNQKGNTLREKEFKKVKEVLQKAMDEASNEDIDIEEDKNFIKHSDEERIFLFLNRACKGDLKTIRRYLKTDPTLCNKTDYDKRSALHMAVAEGHIHLLKFLLNQNILNKDVEDRWKCTPYDEAVNRKDSDMIELLRK